MYVLVSVRRSFDSVRPNRRSARRARNAESRRATLSKRSWLRHVEDRCRRITVGSVYSTDRLARSRGTSYPSGDTSSYAHVWSARARAKWSLTRLNAPPPHVTSVPVEAKIRIGRRSIPRRLAPVLWFRQRARAIAARRCCQRLASGRTVSAHG